MQASKNPKNQGKKRPGLATMAVNGFLPTPNASDHPGKNTGKRKQRSIPKMVREAGGKTSKLNPGFWAEMMGFPVDWTELPFQGVEHVVPDSSKNIHQTRWENFPTQSPVFEEDDCDAKELAGITFSKWRNESIKAYGNAIVPQVALQIFRVINMMEEINDNTKGGKSPDKSIK